MQVYKHIQMCELACLEHEPKHSYIMHWCPNPPCSVSESPFCVRIPPTLSIVTLTLVVPLLLRANEN